MSVYPKGLVEKALLHMDKVEDAIPTGYEALDEKLGGGFQKGYLYTLGGRPGMGKTTLALNIMDKIMHRYGKKVLYYSYQLDPEIIMRRLLIMESHGNEAYYQEAAEDIRDFNFIIDRDPNFASFGKSIYEGVNYDDVDYIVVDDLQHISLSCFYESGGVCERLKEIAEERNIPILVVSNLTKAVEEKFVTDRPIIPDLSGSPHGDSAAQFSDVVMFLYEDGYYNPETEKKGIAEIIIAKNATGPSGTCEVVHLADIMYYAPLARN